MNTQPDFTKKRFFYIIKYMYIIMICSTYAYQCPIYINLNKNNITHNTQIDTVILYSQDPFDIITRSIKKELYLNNINVICNPNDNLLNDNTYQHALLLNILNIEKNRVVVSVFQNGVESEYQIILKVNARYCNLVNKQDSRPINVRIQRTLITDPNAALSNIIQENEIFDIMKIDAAQQLIQKFLIQLKY